MCVRERSDSTALSVRNDVIECLWVRGMDNKADVIIGFCCSSPSQDDSTDE